MFNIKFIEKENKAIACDKDREIGECEFIEYGNTWNIIHTGVDDKYQGQGIAKKLVECVVKNAEIQNKKIIADCSYAKRVIEKMK